MLKTETLPTERPSSFSALINAESGDLSYLYSFDSPIDLPPILL